MTTMNDRSSTDADVHGKTTQRSPNEVKFDEAVKALLAENHTHHNLKLRLSRLVREEGQKHPPIKVVYCTSYGQFGFSEEFRAFLHSRSSETYHGFRRSDPALIQAISDYGRFLCDRFPFILDDMRTVYTWKLDKLLANLSWKKQFPTIERSTNATEFNPDMVAEATSFADQMSNAEGYWRDDCLGSFPNGERTYFGDELPEISLRAFTEMHPDFWMAQHCIASDLFAGPATFQVALRFAHVLLQGGDHARYHVEPDEAQDAAIYQHIGLCGASKTGSKLAITEIPALVDYSIKEYDGQETVEYGC